MSNTSQSSLSRKVLLYQDEDGFFIVEVPSLPGCVSQGETRDEALVNIKEAISLHIGVLIECGQSTPRNNVEIVNV